MTIIKKYQSKKIGEVYISNEGCRIEVVGGGSKNGYCLVRIEGGVKPIVKEVCYDNCYTD